MILKVNDYPIPVTDSKALVKNPVKVRPEGLSNRGVRIRSNWLLERVVNCDEHDLVIFIDHFFLRESLSVEFAWLNRAFEVVAVELKRGAEVALLLVCGAF